MLTKNASPEQTRIKIFKQCAFSKRDRPADIVTKVFDFVPTPTP